MNWTGGARSRVQKKLKQRSQQEFFKKQRLQSTLEAHKTHWPEVEGGQDVQRLKMFARRIASSPAEADDKAAALMTPRYSENGNEDPLPVTNEPRSQGSYYKWNPEWLQVTCEESQGSITLPQNEADDGLIPGVDFYEDEHSVSPQQCQLNFATTSYSQQSTSNHMFPWAPVQSDEHPVSKSPPDQPETPSVRWALRQQPKGRPSWSLQSSNTASSSSFTPCTSTSYRGSPQSGSSAVMTVSIHPPGTPANTKMLHHSLQRIALHSRSTPEPNTGIPGTPANTLSLARRSFTPQTPALTRRPPNLQQINTEGTRTPLLGLQQTRSVPESPMTRSPSLAGLLSLKVSKEKNKEKEQVSFQYTSVQDTRSSQSGQERRDAFDTPRSNSSPLRGQSCHRTDVTNRTEPSRDQEINVGAKGPQHSLKHQLHAQGPQKCHAALVTVQDHRNDLKKHRSETVHIQRSAERITRPPTSALQRTVPEINRAPADSKQEAVLDAPTHSFESKSLVRSTQVAPKMADTAVEYPSVSEKRNMDSFYNSAWILGLQRRHQELLMEEIKAQIMYKPVDRFSIMSIFEDNDDPFTGHKSHGSALPYRTLDEELHTSIGSSSSSPASQDIVRHAGTKKHSFKGKNSRKDSSQRSTSKEPHVSIGSSSSSPGSQDLVRHTGTKSSTKRQSFKGKNSSQDSLQCSHSKTRRAEKRHGQPSASQSLHQHVVSLHQHTVPAECPAHVQGEVGPVSSEVRETSPYEPISFKEQICKQTLSPENVSANLDTGKTPSFLTAPGASGSENGKQQEDRAEQCTPLTSTVDPAHVPHSDISEQVCANELKKVTVSCKPSPKHCRCGELKVDKACQAQPDVATVGTSYDA